MRTAFRQVIYCLIGLQIADGVTTGVALSSGAAVEANPLAVWLIGATSLPVAIVAGKALVIVLLWWMSRNIKVVTGERLFTMTALAAFYLFAVVNNFFFM